MEDYANAKITELEECLLRVARYISKERYEKYHNLLIKGELPKLSEILMKEYYDPLYDVGINKYTYDINLKYDKIEEAVEEVITYLKNNKYED